jgi:hypothetical protein
MLAHKTIIRLAPGRSQSLVLSNKLLVGSGP